jgi:predicted nuclease of predicted toxin-antitoxin system
MSVALYMNVHVPRQITRGLRRRGVDALTAQEDGTIRWKDADLLDRAKDLNRVLFSQDQDLLCEAAKRLRDGVPFAGVIYTPQMALSVGQTIEDLELLAKAGLMTDFADRVQYLPLH